MHSVHPNNDITVQPSNHGEHPRNYIETHLHPNIITLATTQNTIAMIEQHVNALVTIQNNNIAG